jgi:zinc D-Ala-D-Ala carboxypeptidase
MTELYYEWNKGDAPHLLSTYFSTSEFSCKCSYPECVRQKIAIELVDKLTRVRAAVGKPIQINSGYRCNRHQADLVAGGQVETVQHSTHELGRAADITCRLMTPLLEECEKEFKAIGVARNWLHVDLRDDKTRRWTYK